MKRRFFLKIQAVFIYGFGIFYRQIAKRLLFLIPADFVHERILDLSDFLGRQSLVKRSLKLFFLTKSPKLKQEFFGVTLDSPIGLAAGFDYKGQLTQLTPSLGFGFQTVGTITNLPYSGNPPPMLGRLPRSRSLMVNKGFKNDGVQSIIRKLQKQKFEIPIGISIGRTNSRKLITQKESVKDIVTAFNLFEKSKIKCSYYELNISCPNLYGNIDFYESSHLKELLSAIEKLKIRKPIFIKMPIDKTDKEILTMLSVISKFKTPKAVIFGNLQKNRKDPALNPQEVKKFKTGNFSGKPTERRSNELIKLAYRNFGKKLLIIGCGGIFNAQDAYRKIRLGASLVQLITGLIYQGPQLVAQINLKLPELLEKDGFGNIQDAVGTNV